MYSSFVIVNTSRIFSPLSLVNTLLVSSLVITLSTRAIGVIQLKHSLSKHIGMDSFFLRDQYGQGTLVPHFISSEQQLADLITKPQTRAQHDFLLSKLSVYDPP